MDAVKEFWDNSPTSPRRGHRAGEYNLYPTACGKRSVKYNAIWNVPDDSKGDSDAGGFSSFPSNAAKSFLGARRLLKGAWGGFST